MRNILIALGVLMLGVLACVLPSFPAQETPTASPVPALSPTASPSATPAPTERPEPTADGGQDTAVVRQYSVNIRAEPNVTSGVTGYVYADDVVIVLECQKDGDYCKIEQPFGWIYRGCLTGYEEGRGCEAR